MALDIIIPKLGLTMEEAVLITWHFAPGEMVALDEAVLVIETDKVSYDLPSPGEGLLHPVVAVGTTVKVSQVVGYLAHDRAELEKLQNKTPTAEVGVIKSVTPKADSTASSEKEMKPSHTHRDSRRIKASPLAKAMAAKHGLNLSRIQGSGPDGRIVRADIDQALEHGETAAPVELAHQDPLILTPAAEIPVAGIRKIIAGNMHLSLSTQAQLTLHTEASATNLVNFRGKLNRRYEVEGPKVSYNAIILKAVAHALCLHPNLNSSLDGEVIKTWNQINIGLAMDSGDGLLVPKIRKPHLKGIKDISREIDEMTERARAKKLLPDDLASGTFTITNLGPWDIDHFTPIVNHPESAILGVGRIEEKMVVKNGQGFAESRLSLSLTIDHRIVDGAPGAAFLKTVKDFIEDPLFLLE